MSSRGRQAALPLEDHSRPEILTGAGLTVLHYNRQGKVKRYDFAELPVAEPMQRSLAALFAARCVPHRWTTHLSSKAAWISLMAFTTFIARQKPSPRDLDELTAITVRRWRQHALEFRGRYAFTMMRTLLRSDPRLQAGPVADELARRIREPMSGTCSYTEAEFEQIVKAARRHFRAAVRRIDRNAEHLRLWREGAFDQETPDWVLGECFEMLAATGELPRRFDKNGVPSLSTRYKRALRQQNERARWHQLLFLSRLEATSLAVLLMAEFGWNLSVIDCMPVPRASPDSGADGKLIYRVELEKPRRSSGARYETRNISDDAADSPGRLLTDALRVTRFARAVVENLAPGTDKLIVWRHLDPARDRGRHDRNSPVGPFGFGIPQHAGTEWGRTVAGMAGSPFRRGRRTVVALDRREPTQHSQDTHDRHYALVDKRVQANAVEVIAGGAEDAVARAAILVADLRPAPTPGDIETATADCADYTAGPDLDAEGRCGASFLMCLGCINAHIHPGHHARLTGLHHALTNLRSVMSPATWESDWGDAHTRLEDLKNRLGDGIWAQAAARITASDRTVIDHLLTGDLDR